MCQGILLAAACVDESDHLTLVNAGDEEVVSQEEGGREGSAAGGEEGGCLPLVFGGCAFPPVSLGPAGYRINKGLCEE